MTELLPPDSWSIVVAFLAASTAVLAACLLLCRTLWRQRPALRCAACTATTVVLLPATLAVAPPDRRASLAGVSLFIALTAGTLVACTPVRERIDVERSPSLGSDPGDLVIDATNEAADAPTLDPVLTGLGFHQITKATLEFVWDHGGHGDVFRLPDGRKFPQETEWVFEDPLPVLEALAAAKTIDFTDDSWPEAKAEYCLYGELPDGRRVQISFHARRGHATVSRTTTTEKLEGGAWHLRGGEDELIALMQTGVPSMVEVPLLGSTVWTVEAQHAPTSHEIRVLRSAEELARHLEAFVSKQHGGTPDGFDFAQGVVLCIRPPVKQPAHGLRCGTPVLRDGTALEQLVFESPVKDAVEGRAPVMLLFVEVPDPAAMRTVVLNVNGKTRIKHRLE